MCFAFAEEAVMAGETAVRKSASCGVLASISEGVNVFSQRERSFMVMPCCRKTKFFESK